MTEKMYPRNLVWAAAATAQRLNGEYVKRDTIHKIDRLMNPWQNYPKHASTPADLKLTNTALMRIFLNSDLSDITPEDYVMGETMRGHFCSMITLVFAEAAGDFVKAAVNAATIEEIPEKSNIIPLIASLPSVYEKNIARYAERDKIDALSMNSKPIDGQIGDNVKLNITVVDCIFKPKFFSHAVNALVTGTNNLLFFFEREKWEEGETFNISGRIKKINLTNTQLHYVRREK